MCLQLAGVHLLQWRYLLRLYLLRACSSWRKCLPEDDMPLVKALRSAALHSRLGCSSSSGGT